MNGDLKASDEEAGMNSEVLVVYNYLGEDCSSSESCIPVASRNLLDIVLGH